MKQIKTNKIKPTFHYDSIDRDFAIFRIRTTDEYIKGTSLFLDIKNQADKAVILSAAYDKGKDFYIMARAGRLSERELIALLREYDGGEKLSLRRMNAAPIAEEAPHILVQLFLSSLLNPEAEEESYNNVSGKMIYLRQDWTRAGKGKCLEVKVHDNMCLGLHACSITTLAHEKKMDFSKAKKEDYAQYKLAENTLQCVSPKEWNRKKNYIFKPLAHQRAEIPYCDLTKQKNHSVYEKFGKSKLGILYELCQLLKKHCAQYLALDFCTYDVSARQAYTGATGEKRKAKYKELFTRLLSQGINIIDGINTEESRRQIEKLCEAIKTASDIDAVVGSTVAANMANIHYIHNKSWYERAGQEDAYKKYRQNAREKIIQHITIEDFDFSDKSLESDIKPEVVSLLKELIIKKDLLEKKVNITDWQAEAYAKQGDMTFGIIQRSKDKNMVYTYMVLHPDGSFEIQQDDSYIDFDGINPPGNITYTIQNAAGDMNYILEPAAAAESALPYDFMKIGRLLEKEIQEEEISGAVLYKCVKELCSKVANPATVKLLEDIAGRINQEAAFPKQAIMDELDSLLPKAVRKALYTHIYEAAGIVFRAYFRDEAARDNELFGVLDINCLEPGDGDILYCVGEIGKGMDQKIQCAPRIRRIKAAEGSKIFFQELLPLLNVDFVRYGRLTVIPFPFKYIREWASMNSPC